MKKNKRLSLRRWKTWTAIPDTCTNGYIKLDIEAEVLEELNIEISKSIREELDFMLLSDALTSMGWHCVKIKNYTIDCNGIDIADWTDINCQGKHVKHGLTYIFEQSSDAVAFTLKWGG